MYPHPFDVRNPYKLDTQITQDEDVYVMSTWRPRTTRMLRTTTPMPIPPRQQPNWVPPPHEHGTDRLSYIVVITETGEERTGWFVTNNTN